MRSFIICTNLQISLGKVKEHEVRGVCSTHGRGVESVQSSGGKSRRKVSLHAMKALVGRGGIDPTHS
jgi:hypothetical protein